MKIIKIISGGQTGADRGGLDSAIQNNINHGGYCPKNRKSEKGKIPKMYKLIETISTSYLARTKLNVQLSDATIVFTHGNPYGGSMETIKFAQKQYKPYLHIDIKLSFEMLVRTISRWLKEINIKDVTLNIAGSRESKSPGIQNAVMDIMNEVVETINILPMRKNKPMKEFYDDYKE